MTVTSEADRDVSRIQAVEEYVAAVLPRKADRKNVNAAMQEEVYARDVQRALLVTARAISGEGGIGALAHDGNERPVVVLISGTSMWLATHAASADENEYGHAEIVRVFAAGGSVRRVISIPWGADPLRTERVEIEHQALPGARLVFARVRHDDASMVELAEALEKVVAR